ncbi:MAG: hypothetical protein J6T96_11320 [Bacteroidales bacterium]|nr:hypothetical protein [Bacteroidales bacterium]
MNHLYDLLSKLYCSELFDYLDGYDCTTQLFTRYEQFTFYGFTMLLSSIGIAAIYYFAINHPRWNHRGHWLLFLALAVVVNFLIGFYFTNDDLTNGNLNSPQTSCLLFDANGNQLILPQDCLMFGLSNAIFAAIFFFIASVAMKFGSRNCKYVPF